MNGISGLRLMLDEALAAVDGFPRREENIFRCLLCQKDIHVDVDVDGSIDINRLIEHIRDEVNYAPYHCGYQLCDVSWPSEQLYNLHHRGNHPNKEKLLLDLSDEYISTQCDRLARLAFPEAFQASTGDDANLSEYLRSNESFLFTDRLNEWWTGVHMRTILNKPNGGGDGNGTVDDQEGEDWRTGAISDISEDSIGVVEESIIDPSGMAPTEEAMTHSGCEFNDGGLPNGEEDIDGPNHNQESADDQIDQETVVYTAGENVMIGERRLVCRKLDDRGAVEDLGGRRIDLHGPRVSPNDQRTDSIRPGGSPKGVTNRPRASPNGPGGGPKRPRADPDDSRSQTTDPDDSGGQTDPDDSGGQTDPDDSGDQTDPDDSRSQITVPCPNGQNGQNYSPNGQNTDTVNCSGGPERLARSDSPIAVSTALESSMEETDIESMPDLSANILMDVEPMPVLSANTSMESSASDRGDEGGRMGHNSIGTAIGGSNRISEAIDEGNQTASNTSSINQTVSDILASATKNGPKQKGGEHVQCVLCGTRVKRACRGKHATCHMQKEGEYRYQCLLCPMRTIFNDSIKLRHLPSVHKVPKPVSGVHYADYTKEHRIIEKMHAMVERCFPSEAMNNQAEQSIGTSKSASTSGGRTQRRKRR